MKTTTTCSIRFTSQPIPHIVGHLKGKKFESDHK